MYCEVNTDGQSDKKSKKHSSHSCARCMCLIAVCSSLSGNSYLTIVAYNVTQMPHKKVHRMQSNAAAALAGMKCPPLTLPKHQYSVC
eukprot:scaffold186092_cov21-Tisochrysis_lutea.AAC.1